MVVSNSLQQARTDEGMSRHTLAERSGVDVPVIEALESGYHQPSLDTAMRLCAALDLTVGQVFAHVPEELNGKQTAGE
jgi:DNA-binding XRE family transcriptional regulator